MKRIFLSGSGGFIGRNIAEQLDGKFDISCPKRNELDLLDAEAVRKYLKENEFDAVIHAANIGGTRKSSDTDATAQANLACFFNIAKCKEYFGRMVQLGSGAEYGKNRALVRIPESEFGAVVPKDHYGKYKYECAKYAESTDGITNLRIFGCYGKYEDYEIRFISNAICRSLCGMPIIIKNQDVVFSYLYVDDLAAIISHFVEHPGKFRSYNAVPPETIRLSEIANMVRSVDGGKVRVEVKNPGQGLEYSGDSARLEDEMRGMRFTSMREGIEKLYKWYSDDSSNVDFEKIRADKY